MAGFVVLVGRRERFAISRSAAGNEPLDPAGRTAIVMPIRNEDVARVFAGLRATYESLARTGELAHFDFFVLSDTSDPDTRVAEVAAWERLCRDVGGFGRIFYRWRTHRIKRKSGNIADFCRRWGDRYRYMVVLDADSVMSGACLATLVRLAERPSGRGHHPDRAARDRPRHAVRAHPAVRHAHVRPAVHRRPALLAARRVALLGPQRDHPRRAVHRVLRACTGCPARARCRARSCRTTSSRPR